MIRVRQLTKSYGSNMVLRGIDLDVPAGEFVVILGQSGAGKSTFLRCLNQLVTAEADELIVAGLDARQAKNTQQLRCQVAMIFQHHHLVPRLSVLKNVLTGRLGSLPTLTSILQLFRSEDVTLARDCLSRVGLAEKADARADALSGGQMQRVGIARALAQCPQIILADEPIASLDPQSARKVLQCLRDVTHELGITVVCNLHQVEYAREFGDRIIGLAHGRLVFDSRDGALSEADLKRIYPDPHSEAVSLAPPSFVGEPSLIRTATIGATL